MVINVGINGFGRVGRIIFRTIVENKDIEVTAINDPAVDINYICYLIRFDSTHGQFKGSVIESHDEIEVNGNTIKVFNHKQPSSIPWHEAHVDYVIEASGMFTSVEKASEHLKSTVRKVIVTSPSADVPMLVLGVNEADIQSDDKVVSCASSTLYCLALISQVLEGCAEVEEGFVTCVHAMTSSLKPLDGLCVRGKHWRDHRGIYQNIIPTKTGVCKALGKILPRLADRLSGLVYRVPIVNVSVLDLNVRLSTQTNIKEILTKVEEAAATTMRHLIRVSNESTVSSDFTGDSHSCVVDAQCCQQLSENFFKIVCWYENEYSYACRVVDTIKFCEMQAREKIASENSRLLSDLLDKNPTEIQNKLLGTTSYDTALKIEARNPTSFKSLSKEIKRISDVVKIWHSDEDEFKPQKILNSFSSEAQERLIKVKQEFKRMIDKTEDLISKSQCNKINIKTCTNENYCVATVNNARTRNSSSQGKVVSKTTKPNYSGDSEFMKAKNSVRYLRKSEENSRDSSPDLLNTSSEDEFKKYEDDYDSNNLKPDKTSTATLVDKASQSKFLKDEMSKKYHTYGKTKQIATREEVKLANKGANKKNTKQSKTNDDTDDTNSKHKTDKKIYTIVAPPKNEEALNVYDPSGVYDDTTTDNAIPLISELNIESQNSLNRKENQDILEKIDSASDTDSELSMRLRERKSQVIELSDLTTSDENLQKIDKICRIIEISDELSDRLFSPLVTSTNPPSKEWSFSDLCDKINLDEFCKDVFGKPSV